MLALALGYLLGGRWSLHDPSLSRLALILMAGAATIIPVMGFADPGLELDF